MMDKALLEGMSSSNVTHLTELISTLRTLPSETPWLEFKVNHADPQSIGEYISGLSNSAAIKIQVIVQRKDAA